MLASADYQQPGSMGGPYDSLGGAFESDAVAHLHERELVTPGEEDLVDALPCVPSDFFRNVVIHAPGRVCDQWQALAVDRAKGHASRRGDAEGEFEEVVAGAVQFQCHHDAAFRYWGGLWPLFAHFGAYQDHRHVGPCHDGHADVSEEIALDGHQAARTEHDHHGLRCRSQQRVLGVVGNQAADNGKARVARLEPARALCTIRLAQ